jgi:hypothetical protein
MNRSKRLMIGVAFTAMLSAISSFAMAQQPPNSPPPNNQPPGQGLPNHPPGRALPPRQGAAQFHRPGPGPGHVVHAIGERGYSFRGDFHGRREVRSFSERERAVWLGGHWRHEMHGGRMGYWWEVNGAWYFYDRPFDGPPEYVSEVEILDDPGVPPGAPVVVQPAPVVVVAPPVVVVRPPPPPVVCLGPLCVR